MSKVESFTMKEFLKQENIYHEMFFQIKARVFEIVQDFGIIDEGWHITSLDVYDEEFDEYYVNVMLGNNSGEQKRFDFDARWLYSDDYKEQAEKARKKKQAEKDALEYQKYLILKEKFENNN